MAVDEKKRRNMTFRVRNELREAVEELASAKGRSLSEQIEYYVERGVGIDVGNAYQLDSQAVSPTLFRWLTGLKKRFVLADPIIEPAPDTVEEEPQDLFELSPKLQNDMAKAMNSLMTDIIMSSFGDKLTPSMVKSMELMRERMEQRFSDPTLFEMHVKPVMTAPGATSDLERELFLRRTERERMLEAELASARAEAEALKRSLFQSSGGSEALAREAVAPAGKAPSADNYTTASLRRLLASFERSEVNLDALRASGWPQRFSGLPVATRSDLIGLLRGNASEAYDAVMLPAGSRRRALDALRGLRGALLGPSDDDEGPLEDLGDSGE